MILLNFYGPSPVVLTSPHNLPFEVGLGTFGAGEVLQGYSNAFDGDGRLSVGGTPFVPSSLVYSMADGGQTVATANGTAAGLTVHREVTVPGTGNEDFARTIDTFTNSTASPITTTVRFVANLGSDAATHIFGTSDGNTTWDPTDQWIGTDDGTNGSGTPATIHYIYGPGGIHPTTVSIDGDVVNGIRDNLVWTYDLTVPAGQTVRLGYFSIVATTQAAATAAANTLVTATGPGGQAAAFLTPSELDSLVNFDWQSVDTAPPTVTVNQAATQADRSRQKPCNRHAPAADT